MGMRILRIDTMDMGYPAVWVIRARGEFRGIFNGASWPKVKNCHLDQHVSVAPHS